jgi:hypothetical protein
LSSAPARICCQGTSVRTSGSVSVARWPPSKQHRPVSQWTRLRIAKPWHRQPLRLSTWCSYPVAKRHPERDHTYERPTARTRGLRHRGTHPSPLKTAGVPPHCDTLGGYTSIRRPVRPFAGARARGSQPCLARSVDTRSSFGGMRAD